jgi:hypothetical protein
LTKARKKDEEIISKYLHGDPSSFVSSSVIGPDDFFKPPAWLLQTVREIAQDKVETPQGPPIQFSMDHAAAKYNSELLETEGLDFEKFLDRNRKTTLHYGSEFRPLRQLVKLLGLHPNFPELKKILSKGMDYRFTSPLPEATRVQELQAMIDRGNHKSAEQRAEHVEKALGKDVLHGFSMPILPETVLKIEGAMAQPLGMAEQLTLAESGERIPKFRLTQDLSFSLTDEKVSINARIAMDEYVEMIYGWCLPRTIQYIVSMRLEYPHERIFIAKYDYSDAYRRIAHSASAAIQSIALFAGLAFIALRLTFGGSPNPPTWCMFSETVTDLANELLLCDDWNEGELHNPDQAETPTPILRYNPPCLAPARDPAFHIPLSSTARVDGFIDDLIVVFLDTASNRAKAPHAVPLAMHVTSRPHAGAEEEPVPRRNILSLPKLLAEGTPDERQIVLGWLLDTHLLRVSLPEDKFTAWLDDVLRILRRQSCSQEDLDTLVGRLNHTAAIIPLSRHFLGRLRELIDRTAFRKATVRFPRDALKDLKLWKRLLTKAAAGISMNIIVARTPSRVCWSDACPVGLGGYSATGRAWRIRIPESSPLYGHPKVNNLLEFLGMVINVWLEIEDATEPHECILALGDNTSAIGWLFTSSKFPSSSIAHKAHLMVARQLATLVLESDHCLASQHLKGTLNIVADFLSFDGSSREKPHPLAFDSPTDTVLTQRFHQYLPAQIPANFVISPLPSKILSWVAVILQTHESYVKADKRPPMNPKTAAGDDGLDSAPEQASNLTPSSLLYHSPKSTSWPNPSLTAIEQLSGLNRVDLQATVNDQWLQALCARPQATWLRRFGSVSNKAPSTSKTRKSCDLPSNNC